MLLTVGMGGVLRILLEFAGRICYLIAVSFHPWLSGGFAPLSFLRVVVCTAAILVILYILLTIAGIRPYQDLPAGGILGMVRELPDFLAAELNELSRAYNALMS